LQKTDLNIIDPQIQTYAESYSSPEDALLKEIAEYTIQHHSAHHMLSGHLQGQLLEMVSHMIQPRRILEIGTFTGYSALCLAKGLVAGGQLHTIELREADASIAQNFFNRSPLGDRIILHTGNALEIIPELHAEMQGENRHTGLDPVCNTGLDPVFLCISTPEKGKEISPGFLPALTFADILI
jgi:predicted O-methyltransferase YrrM